jgi:hypothetical protein
MKPFQSFRVMKTIIWARCHKKKIKGCILRSFNFFLISKKKIRTLSFKGEAAGI